MEKSSNGRSRNKKGLSIRNLPGVSSSKMEDEADTSNLVGRIVEKGFSSTTGPIDKNPPGPFSLPRVTVVPFPVARHRSHGPHWAPLDSRMQDNDDDDDEDKDETDFDPISAFANPITRKQKKSLDFGRWRDLVGQTHGSTVTQEKGMDKRAKLEGRKPVGERENTKSTEKGDNLLHQSAPAIKIGELPGNSNRSSLLREDDVSTVAHEKYVEGPTGVEVGNRNGGAEETESAEQISPLLDTSTNKEMEGEKPNNSMETRVEIGDAITADSFSGFQGSISKVEQDNLKFSPDPEYTRHGVHKSIDGNPDHGLGHMSLESQIDAENHVRLQQMSAAEIAEAQTEIMEKMKPRLVEVLRKRGHNKLQKQKTMTSDVDGSCQMRTPKDENHLDKAPKGATQSGVVEKFHSVTETAAKDKQGVHDDSGGLQMLGTQDSLWNAWSERVESVRTLRFSLDGTVLENDFIQVRKNGDISGQLSVDNVTERDFLRTGGDPGALGYTVREAIAMTRSMVPAQRTIALQLLGTVLDKALCNLRQSQVGCNIRAVNDLEKDVDWKAVLAFALGPEPELVLSLRMALDDNHSSVVLACAKVIQCALSCDMNEFFFDISEKLGTFERTLCTAPIFRSKPGIDVGFLRGGFWKYSTKTSNILPIGDDVVDDENEEEPTIQDDIVVAGQDFAAGLIRMGVLPRIRYLLEADPSAALEECLISILIGLARHSLTCVNAIIRCERLVQSIVDRFIKKDTMEIHPSKIKSVKLLKVLAQSDKNICIGFIERGIFQDTTWQLYRSAFSLDHWIDTGKEHCKLTSALMVEQLRFWRVCIQYGCCISYFADFFQALCLWLSPPTFDKLIERNVLSEFASISQEAYLVLGALAKSLPKLHSQEQLRKQNTEFAIDKTGNWCWSYVGPMVELAMEWISPTSNPYLSKIFYLHKGFQTNFVAQDSALSCFLWVISSVMHMLSSILERVVQEDTHIHQGSGNVPWLPDFVPKVGLQIVKSRFLSFSGTNVTGYETVPSEESFFVKNLCHLRHDSDNEKSLSSTSCLNALIQLIVSIDKAILVAKNESSNQCSQENSSSRDGKILEDGIIMWSQGQLRNLLITFMGLVALDWKTVQSIETFGRGGPAPGIGLGWGASGGGFWSTSVLLAQADSQLLMNLFEIFQMVLEKDLSAAEDLAFTLQRINSSLGVCLTVVPTGKVIMEKALDILLGAPFLKSLYLCVDQFLWLNRGIKSFDWEYKEEDYLYFSKILTNHFRNRWLCVKKLKALDSGNDFDPRKSKKNTDALDTIHEDLDESDVTGHDSNCNSLVVEWAHQRLPLPMHWFLSPISTISDRKAAHDLSNVSSVQSSIFSSTDEILEVAKSGLFLLLGLEAMALCTDIQHSPVSAVPLVWKLHSLSMVLLVRISVIEDERSRDVYRTLQELYGQYLDESRCSRGIIPPLDETGNLLMETGNKYGEECLKFQSDVHESYPTFIETFVEQFAAVSYGDVIYGRQVAMHLHCAVEVPVRLATWNALSSSHVLELLPPLENCLAKPGGYLEPVENNEGILEAYVKSWISGALDRAATRGSMTFTLALHHLSSFIFHSCTDDKLLLRNKLVKSLLRDYSRKLQHEGIMLDFIRYNKSAKSQDGASLSSDELERRFMLLKEACEGNSSLLTEVEKLKSSSGRR